MRSAFALALVALAGCRAAAELDARTLDAEAAAAAALVARPSAPAPAACSGQTELTVDVVADSEQLGALEAPDSIDYQDYRAAWAAGRGRRWLWVHITRADCAPCRLVDHLLADDRVVAASTAFDCVRLDAADPRAADYRVAGLPADAFVDPLRATMNVVERGPTSIDQLLERLATRGAREAR